VLQQQQIRPQAPAAQLPPAAPPGFQLNPIHQATLDVVLNAWQTASAKVSTFRCDFKRLEYDPAFGPAKDIPLYWNTGELSFQKPDKGSFQITEVKKYQPPAVAGQQGTYVVDPKAVGEHWVCDGQNVYEYRHDQKQLVVRPIPPQMQGQAIVDGPLPFLFGAESDKLKARYWMIVNGANIQLDPNQIMISAVPKWPADAANYKSVDVILEKPAMLPTSMQIVLPNGGRYVYMFELTKAKVNDPFAQIKSWFKVPEILPGWQRVVEEIPVEQAAQPSQPPR
jgi:TIGR03009 family protein